MDNANSFWAGISVGVVIGLIVIGITLKATGSNYHEEDIVEHGCGYYDPKTGDFTWTQKIIR